MHRAGCRHWGFLATSFQGLFDHINDTNLASWPTTRSLYTVCNVYPTSTIRTLVTHSSTIPGGLTSTTSANHPGVFSKNEKNRSNHPIPRHINYV
jgi:hypothetical protein